MKITEIAERLGSRATSLASLARLELEAVVARTREDLLEVARCLELRGVSKLGKRELATCILDAIRENVALAGARAKEKARRAATPVARVAAKGEARAKVRGASKGKASGRPASAARARRVPASAPPVSPAAAVEPAGVATAGEDPGATAKLDIGPAGKAEKPVAHIPWSYGQDRVAAAAVDPDRLFVHWEVTDQSIERARAALGPAGADAWLDVRVHDTTDLIFDGTNAHAVVDQGVDRAHRQWFFTIGKPTSSAHVEVGMLARDGRFARIARSRRVVFPRKEPAPWRDPEWLTVVPGSSEVHHAGAGLPGHPASAGPAPDSGPAAAGEAPPPFEPIALWRLHESGVDREARVAEMLAAGWRRVEWEEVLREGWTGLVGRAEWTEPVVRTSWEAGPFPHPVEVEPPAREEWRGPAAVFRVGGVTHVVQGPWQVVIRNLGAFREHAVLGRWEVYRSWVAEAGGEVRGAVPGRFLAPVGASEHLGASALAWRRGSELRLGGASEVWRLGASELRLGGASELLSAGASERRLGGASERRVGGASERVLGGASERRLGGASESRYPKAED